MHLRSLNAVRRMSRSLLLVAALGLLAARSAHALPVVIANVGVEPGTAGATYADTLLAESGSTPYVWSLAGGALPEGFALGAASGIIAGSTTVSGSYHFIALVTDALGDTASRAFTLAIAPGPLATLTFVVQPSNVLPNALISPAPQLFAGDEFANPIPGAIVTLALSGSGTLAGGGSQTTDLAGLAAFPGLSVNLTGTKQLLASSGAVGPVASASFTVIGVPAAVTTLAVTRTTAGNDADGTIKLAITFTPTTFAASAEVYRAPFGSYPRYDDAGGLTPPTPSYPPGAPWVLTPVTASGQSDEPTTRDAYAYVVFEKNAFGQVSAVSNKTAPAPDYALGDVSNGIVAGAGDNQVTDLDVSLLGAHYGIGASAILSAGVSYLDVGPTVDFGMGSRPFTDGRIDFEDLIVFATNYGAVSSPASVIAGAQAAARAARGRESLALDAPSAVAEGERFDVTVSAEAFGRMQGLSAALAWDAGVAEPIAMTSSGWLERERGVLWSAAAGQFDAALLGARTRGLVGRGPLATFTFRALRAGDPAIHFARALARDAANRPLDDDAFALAGGALTPGETALLAPSPNPSAGDARIAFTLAQSGAVDLAIYSVDGRRVRTLAHGLFAAGLHGFTWDGRDDAQHAVAPGVYFSRLVTAGHTHTQRLVQLH